MKPFYMFRVLILTLILLGWNAGVQAQTASFNYTGGIQTYVVPAGVTYLTVDMAGGSGGNDGYYGDLGGYGGRTQGTVVVTPGAQVYVYIGGAGVTGSYSSTSVGVGGWNGGGNNTYYYGGGGGGATDIRIGGTALSNRVVVAGGGGGAGYYSSGNYSPGGHGGGLTGGYGYYYGQYNTSYSGGGGTQTAGGTNPTGGVGTNAGAGIGGNSINYGGGGGGGYYGGAGGSTYGGGGGGSSYASATIVYGLNTTMGYNAGGNGYASLTPTSTLVGANGTYFSYTGGIQTYVVPAGVTAISIDATGASGGKGWYYYGYGGGGGRVQSVMAVTPGQTYYLFVGGKGIDGTTNSGTSGGGWNGGGNGSGSTAYGGGGGGATDMRFGGTAISNRILVAGGGGGGGYDYPMYGQNGGNGGGLTGENGHFEWGQYEAYTPTGGSQTAGGNNGTSLGGSASTQGSGSSSSVNYAGGGGGGYWGGGCGYAYGSGAGGSSYPAAIGGNITTLAHTQGYNKFDNGGIVITPVVTPPTTGTFGYSGNIQTYTVPSGVTFLNVDMAGGSGGDAYAYYGKGGCGGRLRCNLAVTPGQIYYIYTGGKGPNGSYTTSVAGGFNGGGNGGTTYYGGGGGGATDIRLNGTALGNRVLVAGGGGGAAYNCSGGQKGGDGGGLTGGSGYYCSAFNASYCGTGGTQSAGGNNGTSAGGTASLGVGSNASSNYSGGGGGGYYGGGGGYLYGGGGGGSSFPAANGGNIYGLINDQAYNCNKDGYCILTPTTAPAAATTTTSSFVYTGSVQTYSVPAGVTAVAVEVKGASGGNAYSYYGIGGCGGTVSCNVSVTPGQLLYLYTGGKGMDGTSSSGAGTGVGGFNGGGNSYNSTPYAAGGGGESDIRTGGSAIGNRIVVAGGGGGAGYNCSYFEQKGGDGGGLTGGVGMYCGYFYPYYSPTGGTQTGSGLNGTAIGGASGSAGVGANGYTSYSAGSGGGYYGGGQGYAYTGGGGGSSYYNPAVASSVISIAANNCYNNGVINVTPICNAGYILGSLNVCVGGVTALTDLTAGGGWLSGNTAVATVTSGGVVSGVSSGTAIISYGGVFACGTIYTTQVVNVVPVPTSISGGPLCQSLAVGLTSSGGGTWSSSNTAIATIDFLSGSATGVASGTATITYMVGSGCYTSQTMSVNPTSPIAGSNSVCPSLTIGLSDLISVGTWSSSNTLLATITSSGVVTGVSGGNPIMSYKLASGCTMTYPITVNPAPSPITGVAPLCVGSTMTISTSSTGGAWTSSATTLATVGSLSANAAIVTGVSGLSNPIVTYTLPTTCIALATLTINPLPVPITSTGGSCVTNSINPTVTLIDGTALGTWSVSNGNASIVSNSGQVTGLTAGPLTVSYVLPTGCLTTAGYTIYPLPKTIAGSSVICANTSAYMSDASIGGTWLSSNAGIAAIGSGSGLVTGVSSGSPVISYTLPTGCLAITNLTVNAAPGTVSGSTSVCVNSNTTLAISGGGTWSSSSPGLASVTPGPGVSGGVVTGNVQGNPVMTYTLPGTGCFSTTTMTVNPIPAAITPIGGVGLCLGKTTTLNEASIGGTWSSSLPGTAPVSTGGLVTTVGTIVAATPVTISYAFSTGCQVSSQVTVNPLPVSLPVSPSGASSYCASGAGIDVNMTTSSSSVNYQLSVGGVPVGSPLSSASGGTIDFLNQTAAGTYSVLGVDKNTGCSSTMSGGPTISINPAPNLYTVGFTGSPTPNFCDVPGAAGVDIILSGSQTKVGYILNVDGVFAGLTFGTGTTLDLLPQSTTGNYTVIAQDSITLCQINMVGSVNVGKFALPTPQDVTIQDLGLSTGAGSYCASGPGVHVGLKFGSTGVNYQLWDTTNTPWTLVNTVAGSNSSLDFGYQQAVVGTPHVFAVVGVNPLTSCTNNMNNYVTVTADPLPTPYVLAAPGGSSYCLGGNGDTIRVISSDNGIHYQLYNGGTAVGSSVAGTTFAIDFLNITSKGAYTVVGTDDLTGCTNTMTGSVNVNTYPAIAPYDVMVNGSATGDSYCSGAGGLHVTLNKSDFNITYYLYYNGVSMNDSLYGSNTKLDFGADTGAGVYTVIGRSTLYNCTATMNNNPAIAINSLPAIYPTTVTNGGYYCAGGAGVNIGVSFSDVGIDYQLYKGAGKIGSVISGSGAAIDYGTFATPGTYTVIGTNRLTSCSSNMSGSANVSVNALPAVYTITGGGSYCTGSAAGVPVGLTNSGSGINYQLFNGTAQIGTPVSGTGTTLSFGNQTATGLYTVIATDALSGCAQNMAGSKVISVNPLPNVYAITGGGTYCAGSTAAHVGLGSSTTGIQYQLFNGATPIGTLAGSGSVLDFGPQGTSGTYTITASNGITGCGSNMSGIATVVVNPLPAVQTVGGGGAYCAGTSGAHIYLTTGSQPGIGYQAYMGSVAQGSPVTGTGVALDLGPQTTAGSYTVVASDAGTGCSMNMTGSATVSINALPSAYTVSGGGTLCAGAAGYNVTQTGSATGISYQLFNSATPGAAVKTMIGTGALLDFGSETNAGTYTVIATNSTTGCVNNMIGSAAINVNAAPDMFAVTGGGHFCTGASGVVVGLAGSVAGINYQLYNGSKAIGLPVGGTGTLLSFGPQTASGTYTIMGTNTMTTCTGSMTGNTDVVADAVVTPAVSITGTDGISCIGQAVNYTTSVINGGTAPTYMWKVGAGIVSGSSSYSGIPANGDVITVSVTSSANCATPATVTTSIKMNVMPYVTPSATVSADPGNSVCNGTPVTFTASPVSGGTTPGYSWLVNGVVLPTASSTSYNYTPVDGDAVVFMLRSSERCRTADSVFSDPIAMNVDDAAAPGVTVVSHLGPVVNVGQVDTFIVTLSKKAAGASYTYQWFVNGSVVTGADMPIFIDHNVFNNDNVSVIVTKNGACGNQSGTAQTAVVLHNLGAGNVTTITSDITVLPNPSKGEFNVKGTLGTSTNEEVTLEITDMLGQVVYNGKVMSQNGSINEHISMKNTIANGMYLLSVHSESVNTVFHLVIEQ